MARLRPCPTCARHVRATERACPFCSGAIPDGAPAPSAVAPSSRAMSRAAILFASAAVVAGCSKPVTDSSDGAPASRATDAPDAFRPVPPYGVAVPDRIPTPIPTPAISPVDAGSDAAAPSSTDAGKSATPPRDAGFRPVPPYGVAVPKNPDPLQQR